jgi:hypothetical protein
MNIASIRVRFAAAFAVLIILKSCGPPKTAERATNDSTQNHPADKISSSSKISNSHIFFENSGSMDGYLNGEHELKVVLSRLAYVLEDNSNEQRFYFYNTKPHPLQVGTTTREFMNRLTPEGIKVGNISNSDLNAILEGILKVTQEGDVGVLVTDGIYSINASAGNLLGQLKVASEGTYHEFKSRLEMHDLETVVIKLNSHFNGSYYPALGGSVRISQSRPYYIWLFGSGPSLNLICNDFKINELPGYANHVIFKLVSGEPPYYSINSTYNKIGSFRPVRNDGKKGQTTSIQDAERRRSEFQFSIGVDMSDVPVEEEYLLDLRNYRLTNPHYKVKEITPVSTLTGRNAFGLHKTTTHLITLSTDKHPAGEMRIRLANNLPQWIERTSTEDDSNVIGDILHTYGFKYLVDGVVRAYRIQSSSMDYFQLQITIND